MKKIFIEWGLPETMMCMLCGFPATVRVSIEDGPALVKVCLCEECAQLPAEKILPKIYYE